MLNKRHVDERQEVQQEQQELCATFCEGGLVVLCWNTDCTTHRLPHWPSGVWISATRTEYDQYSHGICPDHVTIGDPADNAAMANTAPTWPTLPKCEGFHVR